MPGRHGRAEFARETAARRALSSAGERSLHTGEVVGSSPTAPTNQSFSVAFGNHGGNLRRARALIFARAGWQPAATGKMDAADFAGFRLRHQRIGTRSTSNLFPARALACARVCGAEAV